MVHNNSGRCPLISLILLALCGAIFCSGCSQHASAPPQPSPNQSIYFIHTVRHPGESLSLIADWYTGSWKNWPRIAAVNPGLSEKRLKLGSSIRIPEGLIRRTVPLTKSAVERSRRMREAAEPGIFSPAAPQPSMAHPKARPAAKKAGALIRESPAREAPSSAASPAAAASDSAPNDELAGSVEYQKQETLAGNPADLSLPAAAPTTSPPPPAAPSVSSRDELLRELLEDSPQQY